MFRSAFFPPWSKAVHCRSHQRCNGDAFGVANSTTLTVMDLLLATDDQAVTGLLYNGNAARRNEANAVYSALNQAGSVS